MTREEAIKVLRTESIELCGSAPSVCRFWEVLDMAVKALEDVPNKYFWKNEPLTNAQKIRSMSDEELAKLLLDGCRGSKCDDQPQNEWGNVNCFQCRMNWLQMPAEEDKHEDY